MIYIEQIFQDEQQKQKFDTYIFRDVAMNWIKITYPRRKISLIYTQYSHRSIDFLVEIFISSHNVSSNYDQAQSLLQSYLVGQNENNIQMYHVWNFYPI